MEAPTDFQNVRIFDGLQQRGSSHIVRWRVDGKDRSRSFPTKARARKAQRRLLEAVEAAESFDTNTGLPHSWAATPTSTAAYAIDWFSREAQRWAPKTRDVNRQALMHVLPATCANLPTGRSLHAMRRWISDACSTSAPTEPASREAEVALAEAERAGELLLTRSRPISSLGPLVVRDELLPYLAVNLDGSSAAQSTFHKRRTTLGRLFVSAVTEGLLDANPLSALGRTSRRSLKSSGVDVRSLPSPTEYRLFICAVANVQPAARRLVAFMAFTLLTGARPGEVSALTLGDLVLPNEGWGMAVLSGSHTVATSRSGEKHASRGLKARADGSTRVVRLSPELVELLRTHLELWPPGDDGYVFRNSASGLLSENHGRYIRAARSELGWTDGHPFAGVTHYTARHVFISALIRGGVDLAEIARMCGNSPAVILSTYAGVFEADQGADRLAKLESALR